MWDIVIQDAENHVMTVKPYSSTAMALGGVILVGLGLYFIFVRPALLAVVLRYIGASLAEIRSSTPGLEDWLQKVFWVLGGYIVATGLLTITIAWTIFRARVRGSALIAMLTGLASIGWMAVVNFIIVSDFKWLILAFVLPWIIALVAYQFETGRTGDS